MRKRATKEEKKGPTLNSLVKLARGLSIPPEELVKRVMIKMKNENTSTLHIEGEYNELSISAKINNISFNTFTDILLERYGIEFPMKNIVLRIVQQSIEDKLSYKDFENLIKNLSGKNLA